MVTNIVRYRLKEISAGAFVEEAHVRSRLRPTAPAGALSQATTAAADRYVVGIAAEGGDVSLDPAERRLLVLQTEIANSQ